MASVELRDEALVWQIEQLAQQTAQPVEQVLATAVEAYLDQWERQGIEAETRAFLALHDQLVARYAGEHVALYRGEVVDHDPDVALLERRVRARFGLLPVLIAPVTAAGGHDLAWRGGRLAPGGDL